MKFEEVQRVIRSLLPRDRNQGHHQLSMRSVSNEITTIKSITHEDIAPALHNVKEGLLSLTVLAHRWVMAYPKTEMVPSDSDPFLLHRPGSRQSLLQLFKVSIIYNIPLPLHILSLLIYTNMHTFFSYVI